MISTSEGLDQWWTVKSKTSDAIGGEYQFYFSEDYDWKANVICLTKNEKLELKMTDADEDWLNTTLSFEIIETEQIGKSILRFEHRDWVHLNDHFRKTNFCWAIYFEKLKNILEQE